MAGRQTVLLVGGTGRTGRRVLSQLLSRGVAVRAIVRSTRGLPPELAGSPGLTPIEASPLSLSDEALQGHLRGCDAVVSCLGHTISVRGILGPPHDQIHHCFADVEPRKTLVVMTMGGNDMSSIAKEAALSRRPLLRSNFQNSTAPRYFSSYCSIGTKPPPSGAGYWVGSITYSVFGVTKAAPWSSKSVPG